MLAGLGVIARLFWHAQVFNCIPLHLGQSVYLALNSVVSDVSGRDRSRLDTAGAGCSGGAAIVCIPFFLCCERRAAEVATWPHEGGERGVAGHCFCGFVPAFGSSIRPLAGEGGKERGGRGWQPRPSSSQPASLGSSAAKLRVGNSLALCPWQSRQGWPWRDCFGHPCLPAQGASRQHPGHHQTDHSPPCRTRQSREASLASSTTE